MTTGICMEKMHTAFFIISFNIEFKKSCATILFNFEMEDDHRPMHGKDAYGFLYYFIQHRMDKEHTSKNLKPPYNTYRPDNG
jgi:hypothetical protein